MERHHESPYRRARARHAARQPDVRSDRTDRAGCNELLRLRLWTKLALLSLKPRLRSCIRRGFGFEAYAMAFVRLGGRRSRRPPNQSAHSEEYNDARKNLAHVDNCGDAVGLGGN